MRSQDSKSTYKNLQCWCRPAHRGANFHHIREYLQQIKFIRCLALQFFILLTTTSSSISWVQPIANVAATHVGANSVGADLLACVHGGVALIKI